MLARERAVEAELVTAVEQIERLEVLRLATTVHRGDSNVARHVGVVLEIGVLHLGRKRVLAHLQDVLEVVDRRIVRQQLDSGDHLLAHADGAQVIGSEVGIFENVVQKGDARRLFGVHALGNGERVVDVGLTRAINLSRVSLLRQIRRRRCKRCIDHGNLLGVAPPERAALVSFPSW